MTNPQTSSILLDDYSTAGSSLVATNLAQNPGFETLAAPTVHTNYYRFPSAAKGDSAGWQDGSGGNASITVVADPDFSGGFAYNQVADGVLSPTISTYIYDPLAVPHGTGAYAPAVTGSLQNVASIFVKTSVAASMYLKVYEIDVRGGDIYNNLLGTTSWTSTGAVQRVSLAYTLSNIANTVAIVVGYTAPFTGFVRVNGAMVNPGTAPLPYFDGSHSVSDGALVAWTSTPYQSPSTLPVNTVKNVLSVGDTFTFQSSVWQNHGQYSLQLFPTGVSNNTNAVVAGAVGSLSGNGVTFIAGNQYLVRATLRIPAVQTGSLNAAARSLRATYNGTGGTTVSHAASNAIGAYDLSVSFTVPSNATNTRVELWNGSANESVYWDDLLIVNLTAGGAYAGGWFSGSSAAAPGQKVSWSGVVEDSTSLLTALGPQAKLAELQTLSYEYAGINSVYPDDDALSLGVANLTTKSTTRLKNWIGRVVWPRRNADDPRKAVVRSVTASTSTGVQTLSMDTGATERNYDYTFLPVISNDTGVYFSTTDGKSFRSLSNPDSAVPKKVLPGFTGNGLAAMAQLAQAYGVFAVEDANNLSYALRTRTGGEANVSHPQNVSDWGLSVDRAEPARNIEVIWYEGGYGNDIEVIPADANIISVESGETVEVDIETTAWLQNVNQPACVDWVEDDENFYSGTSGVYTVAGNDNRPITAAEWIANGGSVKVSISPDDPRSLHVTVTGMVSPSSVHLSPFRLALTNTIGGFYNTLRVTADAVKAVPHTLKLPTGVDESITKTDVGVTLDNPFIQSLEQAYAVGVPLARKYCGIVLSLNGSGEGILPFQLLDHEWMRYIVRDISGDPTGVVTFDAELYTRMSDFEESWPRATYTMQDFENVWPRSKYTMGQFMLEQLRNPLKDGTGHFFDLYNGLWMSDEVGAIDNGDGTWTSEYAVDNGDGTWTG